METCMDLNHIHRSDIHNTHNTYTLTDRQQDELRTINPIYRPSCTLTQRSTHTHNNLPVCRRVCSLLVFMCICLLGSEQKLIKANTDLSWLSWWWRFGLINKKDNKTWFKFSSLTLRSAKSHTNRKRHWWPDTYFLCCLCKEVKDAGVQLTSYCQPTHTVYSIILYILQYQL